MATDRSALTSIDREKASVFHSWSAQSSINPLMVKSAQGVYVTMEDDTESTNFNRIHVVPPCTITDDEARDGLERLDRALTAGDSFYVGS